MGNKQVKTKEELFLDNCHNELVNAIVDGELETVLRLLNHVDNFDQTIDGKWDYNTYICGSVPTLTRKSKYFQIEINKDYEKNDRLAVQIRFSFNKNNYLQCLVIKQMSLRAIQVIYPDFNKTEFPNYKIVVNKLISKGINRQYQDGIGNTIDHIIANYNNLEWARAMIIDKTNLNVLNNKNQTPFLLALSNDFIETAFYIDELEQKELPEKIHPQTNDTNNTNNTNPEPDNSLSTLCIICMERNRDTMIDACKHVVLCHECCEKISVCPICQQSFSFITKVYL